MLVRRKHCVVFAAGWATAILEAEYRRCADETVRLLRSTMSWGSAVVTLVKVLR